MNEKHIRTWNKGENKDQKDTLVNPPRSTCITLGVLIKTYKSHIPYNFQDVSSLPASIAERFWSLPSLDTLAPSSS